MATCDRQNVFGVGTRRTCTVIKKSAQDKNHSLFCEQQKSITWRSSGTKHNLIASNFHRNSISLNCWLPPLTNSLSPLRSERRQTGIRKVSFNSRRWTGESLKHCIVRWKCRCSFLRERKKLERGSVALRASRVFHYPYTVPEQSDGGLMFYQIQLVISAITWLIN